MTVRMIVRSEDVHTKENRQDITFMAKGRSCCDLVQRGRKRGERVEKKPSRIFWSIRTFFFKNESSPFVQMKGKKRKGIAILVVVVVSFSSSMTFLSPLSPFHVMEKREPLRMVKRPTEDVLFFLLLFIFQGEVP